MANAKIANASYAAVMHNGEWLKFYDIAANWKILPQTSDMHGHAFYRWVDDDHIDIIGAIWGTNKEQTFIPALGGDRILGTGGLLAPDGYYFKEDHNEYYSEGIFTNSNGILTVNYDMITQSVTYSLGVEVRKTIQVYRK